MARDPPIPVDPRDKALLRPLAQLGKSSAAGNGVSFLRRTEYISNDQTRKFDAAGYKDMLRAKENEAQPKRRKLQNLDKEDPLNILRNVIKGFDVAYPSDVYEGEDTANNIRGAKITPAESQAWAHPQHPSKPHLKLLDSYPVLPDPDAMPSIGSYIFLKFDPKSLGSSGTYDTRLDHAILRPYNPNEEKQQEAEAQYEHDLDMVKQPVEYDYEYYLPDDVRSVAGIKRKFDIEDPDNENEELYTYDDEGTKSFRYDRVRTYETQTQSGNAEDAYADSVAIALHDGIEEGGPVGGTRARSQAKAAYFYPILQRTSLRPKRKGPAHLMDQDEVIDQLRVTVHAADEEELRGRIAQRAKLDPTIEVPDAPDAADEDAEHTNGVERNGQQTEEEQQAVEAE